MCLERQFDTIINSIYNGVIVIDREGIITVFNSRAGQILGVSPPDALGRHIRDVIPDSELYKILEGSCCEVNKKEKIGDAIVVVNWTPIVDGGETIGAISVFQDITELENIAEELERVKELKNTLEDVIENPYEGIIVVDKEGIVTMINETYLKIVGRERDEVLGKHISHVSEHCNLPQVLKTGEPLLCDFCNVRERGMITMRVPIMKDGQMVGALGKTLFTDIDTARILNEKLVQLERQLAYYKEEYEKIHSSHYVFGDVVGESEAIRDLKRKARRIAGSVSTVLITGESGTGKEMFAQAIHNASDRWNKPFIKINCAAIPDNLLESELFGYAEGAFTGAQKGGKPGKFELANKGTIFLDEIGDMPLVMQAKLLRVLQEYEVERIGGLEPVKIDVRVIAATNHDLEKMVEEGEFREDLYYRLNVIRIDLPPLRERPEDIPLLIDSLLAKLSTKLRKNIKGISTDALNLLQEYHWPGNVRELENILELAMNMTDEQFLDYDDFPCVVRKVQRNTKGKRRNLLDVLSQVEKDMLINALKETRGDKKIAARMLGIHPSALYRKLKKHDIDLAAGSL